MMKKSEKIEKDPNDPNRITRTVTKEFEKTIETTVTEEKVGFFQNDVTSRERTVEDKHNK